MRWSLKLLVFAGIGVYVHWTFLILLVWLGGSFLASGKSPLEAAIGIGFVLSLFGCVILHEFGHALTARRFGIQTRDITLLPIGGLARLERMPEDPKQELLVAIAGPAVNVVIAGILYVVLATTGRLDYDQLDEINLIEGPFLLKLMQVNIALVVFNLLPAFPMDGGRVLRALLALRMNRVKATQLAAAVGQIMAILFGLIGLMSQHWLLLFIAIFVYLGAQAEAQAVEMQSMFRGATVRDAMTTRFQSLLPTDSLQRAIDELLAGHQQDFPVVDPANPEKVVGVLRRKDLFQAIQEKSAVSVGESMKADCHTVEDTTALETAVSEMRNRELTSLPVLQQGRLVGLLTSENIGEWTIIRSELGEIPRSR